MTKRSFWADFFIATAIFFVSSIVFRLSFLLTFVIPVWIPFALFVAMLIAGAIIFTKRTSRTFMFSVTSLIWQFVFSLGMLVYCYVALDGIMTAETETAFATIIQLLGGLFLAFGFMFFVILATIMCIGVLLITLITSLITKTVCSKTSDNTKLLEVSE